MTRESAPVELVRLTTRAEMSDGDFNRMIELLGGRRKGSVATDDLLALYAETVEASRFAAKDVARPDCQRCGACCAYFQQVPVLMVDATPRSLTWAVWDGEDREGERLRWLRREPAEGGCVAFAGPVGERVSCSVYELRPQACREFEAGSDRCHALRRMYGLEPELCASERARHAELLNETASSNMAELQEDELWPSDEAGQASVMRELIAYNIAKLGEILAEMKRLELCLRERESRLHESGRHEGKRGEDLFAVAKAAVEADVRALGGSGDDLLGRAIASQLALEQASNRLAELGQVAFEILGLQVRADKSAA